MKWISMGLGLALLANPAAAQPTLERKLVHLKRQALSTWAESHPQFDYTSYLPRRYTPSGLDNSLMKAASNASGLPVRLLGQFSGDRVVIPKPEQLLEPVLLPLSLQAYQPWRGNVALRGNGRQMARVTTQGWEACSVEGNPPVADALYEATGWGREGQTVLTDLKSLGPVPPAASLQGPLLALVSEGFLRRSMELYRQAHPQQFRWTEPSNNAGFELSTLGVTTIRPPLRAFASLKGHIAGLGTLVEGEWEAPVRLDLKDGWVNLQLVPSGQEVRLVKPIFAEVPQSWSNAVVQMVNKVLGSQVAMPIPGAYLQQFLATGLATQAEIDSLRVDSGSWGDRRSGSLWLSSQQPELGSGPPQELAWVAPDGFGMAISGASLNRCFAQWLPQQLPMQIDIPKGSVPSPKVLIFSLQLHKMELKSLQLAYDRGTFRFDNCEVAVHWRLGPLSGVEPGARLAGSATPALEGNPPRLALRFQISQLDFLSPQILKQSPAEQAKLRQQILQGVQNTPVVLPIPAVLATQVHPQASLQLVALRPEASHLWLIGRWSDLAK